ncbi:MAG: hypothetical protein ACI9OS_002520, partial [Ulvibacter sp.]
MVYAGSALSHKRNAIMGSRTASHKSISLNQNS